MEQKKKKQRKDPYMKLFIITAVIGVLLVGSLAFVPDAEPEEDPYQERLDSIMIELDSLKVQYDKLHKLSWENIDYWLEAFDIEHPEIVKAQIAVETGSLTSTICLENNNLFGMKEPRVRETTALGTKRRHAYYATYIDSIKDYKLWQDNMYSGEDCYYTFLDRVGYAEANHYIAALKTI